ncbi:hypothetical protein [Psychrobacter cibarius]|uniref:hypothetical protein n=1 Tax=Psychrobacter cibarius TaxID=282669 RepID=UPI00191A4268|nr:hypothetical protein [Psychrobacter cibarius]
MFDIEIKNLENSIVVSLKNTNNNFCEYAFYLYEDGSKISTIWYQESPTINFDIDIKGVEYFVKCFIKDNKKEKTEIITSEKIFIEKVNYDLKKWSDKVELTSLDEIKNDLQFKDGVKIFKHKEQTIDFLVDGSDRFEKDRGILICFSAAVPNRSEKSAPFFSGMKIALQMNMPIIAVSDPSLSFSNNLSLGWYAGNENIIDLPKVIANILDQYATTLNTNLILFGGSGGGFAVLSVIDEMETDATGVVWNPQTSISEFDPNIVRNYIESSFLEDTYVSSEIITF